jgi:dipeptidyl aminopeptidase/acylaminoacyl peptidase
VPPRPDVPARRPGAARLGWVLVAFALWLVSGGSDALIDDSARGESPMWVAACVLVGGFAMFVLGWRMARERRPVGPAVWVSSILNVPGLVESMRSSRPALHAPSSPREAARATLGSREAALGIACGLGWFVAGIASVRFEIRWFPPTSSLLFVALGTGAATLAGAAGAALTAAIRRPSLRFLPVAAAVILPPLAIAIVPPLGPLDTSPLPGRGDYAATAWRDGRPELYLILDGGASIIKLTESGTSTGGADLSPDGRRVAFGDERRGTIDIWIMDLDSSMRPVGLRRLTDERGDESSPAWSPDGGAIAYTERRAGRSDVRVADAETGRVTSITRDGGSSVPSWSPDGASIVYSSIARPRATDYDIWEVRPDGSGAHVVLDSGGDDWAPRLSPDGRRLLYSSNRTGNYDVWVADADGAHAEPLTRGEPAEDHAVAWSPDGRYAIFASNRSDTGGNFLFFAPVTGGPAKLAVVL